MGKFELCGGWALGIIFIIIVILIWSVASFLTQYIYNDLDYRSPFVLTYVSSSFFAVYLPFWQMLSCLGYVEDPPRWRKQLNIDSEADNEEKMRLTESVSDCSRLSDEKSLLKRLFRYMQRPIPSEYSHEDVIYLAFMLTPIWFIGNIFYNYSLSLTSISSSTVISNTSGVFTLFFSWLFGIEEITFGKVLGLILCLSGVVLVAIQDKRNNTDDSSSDHGILGDIVAIIGALCYGLYTTILKMKIIDDDAVSMQLVLGYIGLVNTIVCLPALIILAAGGWGGVPGFTMKIFGFLLVSAFFDDVIADYLWARSVLLTSPTVATVGLSMTIPLAIITDLISGLFYGSHINEDAVSALSLSGAALVLIGFLFVNVGLDPIYKCLGLKVENDDVSDEKNRYGRIVEHRGSTGSRNPMVADE